MCREFGFIAIQLRNKNLFVPDAPAAAPGAPATVRLWEKKNRCVTVEPRPIWHRSHLKRERVRERERERERAL